MNRASLIVLSGVACAGAFLAGWWVIGDQSSTGIDRQLDYILRAPDVPDAAVIAAGVVGLVVVVAILATLSFRAWRQRGPALGEARVVVCAVAVGLVVAGITRVVTAGSVGANIGAGLAMFGGGLLVRFAVHEGRKLRAS